MAHGAPDDSNVRMNLDLFRLDDLAELAARLGSIVTYRRSGSVLYMDDFERGLGAWLVKVDGVGGSVYAASDRVYWGMAAAKITSGTGVNPYTRIDKYIPMIQKCKVGLAAHFSIGADGLQYQFYLKYLDGENVNDFWITYDFVAGTLSYYTEPGVNTVFATIGELYESANNFHNMKLVIDLEANEYVRFCLNENEWSLAGLGPNIGGLVMTPRISCGFMAAGDGVTDTILYIDNVVVTYDEF